MNDSQKLMLGEAVLNESYDLDALAPIERSAALCDVLSSIDDLWNLNGPETLRARLKHFNVPGTTEDDYREKLFELGDGRTFLAGIRHVGGNPNLPFVSVTPGFALHTRDIPDLKSFLESDFKVFRPHRFALWMKPGAESRFPEGQLTAARTYLCRRILDLDLERSNPAPIEVRPVADTSILAWYESEYRIFHESSSDLRDWVTAAGREDLERYRAQDLLFSAHLEGEMVGLVGGERQDLLGLRGLYMGELLMAKAHRGKGLAAAMQRQFLRKVGAAFEIVWGTIDARNKPSMKTALRVGRRPVRTEYFVDLR